MDLKKICVQARDLKRKYRHPKCGAVVVAAGSASRMGGTDKILTKLGGIPVICHSLAVLDACDMVDEIVVVARKDCVEQIRKLCSWYAKVKTVVPGGDSRVASIAAASILAKVTRDRYMYEMAEKYPQYGFDKHKGYGTAAHYAAIREFGPSEIHRMSFLKKMH